MSLFKVYAARCDTCDDVRYTEETSAYDARRSLRNADWTFAQGGANKFITYTCGECNHIIAGRARPLAVETAELNQEAAKRLAAFFKNEDYKP